MVKPKKHLGQHFLKDFSIAKNIADLVPLPLTESLLEIGAGTGILTQFFLDKDTDFSVIEIDTESVAYLKTHFPQLSIIEGDFLELNLLKVFENKKVFIVGNFPYNISSQIFFKILENKNTVTGVVCMLQKEVAERIASKEGNKDYGILSVLLQAFYEIRYHFTVPENVFNPPPKVKSGVIRLQRNQEKELPCNEKTFFNVVKTAFNQRRKTLRNALKSLIHKEELKNDSVLDKRAEQLSVQDFIELTQKIQAQNLSKS
ncbi:MAG: 16S rRNA (adenine(1518)-N(6)/adenine(1519)-N(6))-dimethyltransferase RsmA [Thermonemataceae bacterium]|nr:16S rRNA (adenine(1518)-N(6)/adenine(1519)-N(6))-dimethyltransferase RsmA [Thermonemataceae bacterium]